MRHEHGTQCALAAWRPRAEVAALSSRLSAPSAYRCTSSTCRGWDVSPFGGRRRRQRRRRRRTGLRRLVSHRPWRRHPRASHHDASEARDRRGCDRHRRRSSSSEIVTVPGQPAAIRSALRPRRRCARCRRRDMAVLRQRMGASLRVRRRRRRVRSPQRARVGAALLRRRSARSTATRSSLVAERREGPHDDAGAAASLRRRRQALRATSARSSDATALSSATDARASAWFEVGSGSTVLHEAIMKDTMAHEVRLRRSPTRGRSASTLARGVFKCRRLP